VPVFEGWLSDFLNTREKLVTSQFSCLWRSRRIHRHNL